MADSLVAGVQVRRIDDFKVLLEQCWSLFSEESQRSDDYELAQRQRDAAVAAQAEQEQTIRILSRDLHVWKESHENKCTTIEMLEAEVGRLKERVGDTQSNSLLAVCLIDGDGTIFAPEYLVEGQQGGRRAAKELNERLINHLGVSSRAAFRILVNVYCNKIGLRTTLAYAKFCTFTQFDAFWDGFQATGLFSVIDVGQGKEAADAKIRDALDLYARMPQVMRVYMGGAHDGGYQSPLSALQLSGFGDKVVLLRGYDNIIAKDLRKLGLPEARFEGLFLSKPIDTSGGWRAARSSSSDQGSPRQTDAASSSSLPSTGRACFSFHLQGSCPYGSTCAFDHNKEFTVKELDQLRQAAKTQPCMYINGNKPCSFGDTCVMSHKCRNGPSCSDRTNGTCKWKGRAMHDPRTAAPKSESSHTSNSSASVTSESDRQLILCLVDGNSVNFTQDRMNEARKGGLHCAKMLEAGLRGANPNSGAQIQIIAPYIGDVSNMRVMFPRLGTCSTTQFEGFIAGYAEHDETFTVVNIPGGAPAGQDMLISQSDVASSFVSLR
ncbi:hypothetical protein BKA62DRAFT_182600 [Auriculariales sp. MPI-PUGE-AT-0066]|nr:hypothetical protein BKA62DRAFT_182600 [Auriculariales sp. MPI-PUGE-AT-0066]